MAMLTVLLLLSAAFALGDARNRLCPRGWTQYGSRCFMFVKTARTWPEAEEICISLEANLASVHSSEEAQFLQGVVFSMTGSFTATWLGGFDTIPGLVGKDRLWIWSDGSKFDYQNWNQEEPNNNGGREQCIVMNFGGEQGWNDLECGNVLPSVCVVETFD
ncbi:ladderlectin-like isoform X1 [Coregonus clupeaformis]|uniref:ladderlectin-like isoform X1 n=1 Tax=Coregonus clupeaformis TaxID=59861 RepID=UPI001BDFCE6A|nr:ladderlectin-like isoform X1 [Coregonus clupeaformis]